MHECCRYLSTFVEPMSHTILYGLVKAFLDLICDPGNGVVVDGVKWHLSTTKDGLMSRMNHLIRRVRLTSAYNRGARVLAAPSDGYACSARTMSCLTCAWAGDRSDSCVACRNIAVSRWYFEEVATFLEVTGAISFWVCRDDPAMPPRMVEMWEHLRAYAMYFMFYRPGQHTLEQVRRAQNRLFKFAEFAEEHLQGQLCTLLLHRALVHLPEQVLYAGPGAFMREDFGERAIREVKHKITHHAAKDVAQASAQCCLLEMTLRRLKRTEPDIEAPRSRIQQAKRRRKSDVGGSDGVQLHEVKDGYTGDDNDQVCYIPASTRYFDFAFTPCAINRATLAPTFADCRDACRSVVWLPHWMPWMPGSSAELTKLKVSSLWRADFNVITLWGLQSDRRSREVLLSSIRTVRPSSVVRV